MRIEELKLQIGGREILKDIKEAKHNIQELEKRIVQAEEPIKK